MKMIINLKNNALHFAVYKKQKGSVVYAVVHDGTGRYQNNQGFSRSGGDETPPAGFGIYSGRDCACGGR
jgi:CubicO group peptidase (beta-lactamase class C family)